MITVAVYINNQPIVLKSARNTRVVDGSGEHKYIDESGQEIWHRRDDGITELAKKLLDNYIVPEHELLS